MALEYFNLNGIETYTNPLAADGKIIHSVNMVSYPYGGKSKRPGYQAFLGTPDNAQVQTLLSFPWQDGTTFYLYRASGSSLYYSQQGTGAWTLAANGTIGNGNHFGAAVFNNANFDNILIGGDGLGSTRYTTDGTTFTNTSQAPVSQYFTLYQNKVYAAGSTSTLVNSCTNDPINWAIGGTSDSSSFVVSGEGRLSQPFVASDRLVIPKSRGAMFNWDGNTLTDMATKYGPNSPYAIGSIEDRRFWLNQYGHFAFDGINTQLLSNAVQRYFYNRQATGIQGTAFSTLPGACHVYDYYSSIGTVTDDFTQRQIPNAILNYNYQKNEYLVHSFADNPTSYLSYNDAQGKRQLIFGNSAGQAFQLDPTYPTDNGQVIECELVMLFTYASQATSYSKTSAASLSGASYEKKWNWIRLFFNPGCEANIQGAFSNSFTYQHLNWFDINDNTQNQNNNAGDGIVEYRFPPDTRSRLLFIRVYEASPNSQWTLYGAQIDADVMKIG